MYTLHIDPTWSRQIAAIRDAHSYDTNLIRFSNDYYRACNPVAGQFLLQLVPEHGGAADALTMQVGTRDFYVSLIGGQAFTRYASTIDAMQIDAATLNNAIRAVGTATGRERFELQSLLVFCVAESIRSDLIAGKIEATIRASLGRLLGVAPRISVASMLAQARAWGQSSDAVWASLAPEVRNACSKPPAQRTAAERTRYERIDETRIDPALKLTARGIKVLKRPG